MDLLTYALSSGLDAPTHVQSGVIWGIHDKFCFQCSLPVFLVFSGRDAADPRAHNLICIGLIHAQPVGDLGVRETALLLDRANFAIEQIGSLGAVLAPFLSTLQIDVRHNFELPASTSDVPLPAGYRSVGWIKESEALAVQEAILERRLVEILGANGDTIFAARYFDPQSVEAQKYHALCEAKRPRSNWTKWLRLEEAQAVLEANRLRKSIEFRHMTYGNGGVVEYFPPESPAAKRFKSSMRLLRRY